MEQNTRNQLVVDRKALDGHVVKAGAKFVHVSLATALREGVHGGRKIRVGKGVLNFAIHKKHRHMDKVGHGYSEKNCDGTIFQDI